MIKPRPRAWLPAGYEYSDVVALQAVGKGEATPEQQKRAVDWIINQAAETYEVSFRSDQDGGERETSFAEGRRFVGMQVVKLLKLPPSLVAKLRKADAGQ